MGRTDGRGRWQRTEKKALTSDVAALSAHSTWRTLNAHQAERPTLTWQHTAGMVVSVHLELVPGVGVRLLHDGRGEPVDPYIVQWTTTQPQFGGIRYWWLCPECGRRCATLYGGPRFLCRTCQGLTYATSQSGRQLVAIDAHLARIRKRLGVAMESAKTLGPLPDKPKHMHSATYLRLEEAYTHLLRQRRRVLRPKLRNVVSIHPSTAKRNKVSLGDEHLGAAAGLNHAWMRVGTEYARITNPHLASPTSVNAVPRVTLELLVELAKVPLNFGLEAGQEGLLRPDSGRTTQMPRYRPSLAKWLAKLYALRSAGYYWQEIHAWIARRFWLDQRNERAWPADFRTRSAQAKRESGFSTSGCDSSR